MASPSGEGAASPPPARLAGAKSQRAAFEVEIGGAVRHACSDVRGFRDASLAADDARAAAPARLVVASPDAALAAWLELWSEDEEHVRRTLTIRRIADGRRVTVVATLAAYGAGVETSIAVESIVTPWDEGGAIFRSGIHPRAAVEAALAAFGVDEA